MEWILKVSENMIQYVTDACNGNVDAIAKLYTKTLKASYFLAEILSDDRREAVEIVKKYGFKVNDLYALSVILQ